MKYIKKMNTISLITELHNLAITINESIIEVLALVSNEKLLKLRPQEIALGAAKKGVIPVEGNFFSPSLEKDIRYYFHGGGVDFTTSDGLVVSFEYYPITVPWKPIFSSYHLVSFLISKGYDNNEFNEKKIDAWLEKLADEKLVCFTGVGRYFYIAD